MLDAESWIRLCIYWEVNILSYRETRKKFVLQYFMLSQSVFPWQFHLVSTFSAFLKFGISYITGQGGKFRVKNATLCLHILLWHFFVVFHEEKLDFFLFISFSDKISNFHNKLLTNLEPELVITNCSQFDDYIKCRRPS